MRVINSYDTGFPYSKSIDQNAQVWRKRLQVSPMRFFVILVSFLALLPPTFAWAQDSSMPPLPRPRPGSTAKPTPETTAPIPAVRQKAPESANAAPAADATAPANASIPAATSATEAITAVTSTPQPVHLSAQVTEKGGKIPDGLVWRVFDTVADKTGQLAMVAKSNDATANLELPPGQYMVHVAYGRAQASDNLTVAPGDNSKTIVLDAGALRLNAAVTGDVPIPVNLVHFDIFTSGRTDAERTLVAQGTNANDIVTLNAGTYHVVSYFGDVNAVVRADLRVEPGQLTDATLYHRASQVSFKLVSEAAGEAIADVEWTVKSSDGTTVFSNIGAFPATVLAEGEYTVLAKRGTSVFNRGFEVVPGQAREIEVLTNVYANPAPSNG